MKRRLFVAICLNQEVKDYLFNISKELNLDAKIKWVSKKNLHLTLKFLGWVEDVDKIIEVLSKVKFNSFEFSLKSLGVFDKSRPRVLFVDVEPIKEIMGLQYEIENVLRDLFEKDERFSAHLTMGRIKSLKDKTSFLNILDKYKVNQLKITVNSFCLFESILRREGPEYKLVKEFKLE